jgi:serine/threonine-protein kinase
VFVCTEQTPPALLTRVWVSLEAGGTWVESAAQVVSHVSASQARGWGMSAGYAVQFVDSAPAFREGLARALQSDGTRASMAAIPTTPSPVPDDPVAERALEPFKRRSNVDHYQLLNVARDLDLDEVRTRARELRRTVEALRQRRLSQRQEELVTESLGRIAVALETLGTPVRRAEYDAGLNNFRGVARCIAAGLTVTELEALRKKFLAQRPPVETQSTIHGRTAAAWEASGDFERACEEYEKALEVDPLNLGMQQRYWRLKRRPAGSRSP